MKKLLVKIVVVTFVVIGFDQSIGLLLDKKFENNSNDYANGHLNYYIKSIECDTLFVGSSRMWHHVDTRLFSDRVYNLSQPSIHVGYISGLLHILEIKNKLPEKLVAINVDLNEIRDPYNNILSKNIHQLRYYYDDCEYIRKEINKRSPIEFIKYWSRIYRHNGTVEQLLFNNYRNVGKLPKSQGYYPIPISGVQKINNEFIQRDTTEIALNSTLFTYYLSEIKAVCDRNEIELICITSPYRFMDNNVYSLSLEMRKIMNNLNIRYLNFAMENEEFINPEIWIDPFHLNERGAELFTKKLQQKLTN